MTSSLKYILESIESRFNLPEQSDDDLDEVIDSIDSLEEDNTTSAVEGFDTPYAFGKKKQGKDSVYSKNVPETHRFYKQIGEAIDKLKVNKKIIQELNYFDFKSDDTKSDRQKINLNIKEINKMLSEVERMINHAGKLKQESGADQTVFWKGTVDRFTKINEKLIRLSNKIREMNS